MTLVAQPDRADATEGHGPKRRVAGANPVERLQLIHGDCFEHYSLFQKADALVSDPPYGIGYKVNARPPMPGIPGLVPQATEETSMVTGDDKAFDPAPWLSFKRVALFGANHFANRLPAGRFIIWDKRVGMTPDDHSDCEFVWLNQKGADRIHRQKWRGVCREGEENCSRQKKQHPNQKPVALLLRIFEELKLTPGMIVADPFMGSGSTGVAALRFGLNFIGCELDATYYARAVCRCEEEKALA